MTTIVTNTGNTKLLAATPIAPVTLSHVAFGDGNGSIPTINASATSLVHEVLRVDCSFPIVDTADPTIIKVSGSVPRTFGGYTLREVAVFDNTGAMIAWGSINNEVLPAPSTEYGFTYTATFRFKLSNASMVTVVNSDAPSFDHRGLTFRTSANAHPASSIDLSTGRTVQQTFDVSKILSTSSALLVGEDNYITSNNTFTLPSTTGLANGTKIIIRRKRNVTPVIQVNDTGTEQIVIGKDDMNYSEYDSFIYNVQTSATLVLDSATKRWELQ